MDYVDKGFDLFYCLNSDSIHFDLNFVVDIDYYPIDCFCFLDLVLVGNILDLNFVYTVN